MSTSAPSQSTESLPDIGLEAEIGQMLLVGFRGLTADTDDPVVRAIGEGQVGGVILFDVDGPSESPKRNIASPDQLRELVRNLHEANPGSPLLVTVDQEGGKVRRLKEKHGFTATPSARHLGRLNDLSTTRKHALTTAQTLADMGIGLNLAPSVDVDVYPDNPIIGGPERSYSSDPELVVAHATEFIRAHHEHGVLCALKHFPGHGSSREDTHVGFTDVTETWSEAELLPFSALIGRNLADAVMTAHVFNSHLDPKFPATLSAPTVTGILRDRLGFDGVVLADDMGMGAIALSYGFETALEAAIGAGVDILPLANQTEYEGDIAKRAAAVILRLVTDKKVTRERIHESYRRIYRLKERLHPAATRN